jgi:methionyl-tRNA formyltransferase
LKKEDGRIDWRRPASVIYNRLRGFAPWPGAFTLFRGQQLSLAEARPGGGGGCEGPGHLQQHGKRLFVACGENTRLELLEVQLAGKKRMTAEAFLNGYQIAEQEFLGVAE